MRVAVAGATGVLGRAAMPALAAAGHEVRGFSRSGGGAGLVAIDLLDRDAVVAFARKWQPEAVIHLATAIPTRFKRRGIARQFELTNRLRGEGTRNLLAAAEGAGGARLISQSLAFAVADGPGLADERVPISSDEGAALGPNYAAVAELERLTLDAGGVAMRFGQLLGPGTTFAADGALGAPAARGMLPIIENGGRESVFSFTHPSDAAAAIVAALARPGASGVYNIVDDEPAPGSTWIPELTRALGSSREPRRLPAWLARPLVGTYAVRFMTELRGSSNERAKRELEWSAAIPWRADFVAG